MPEMFTFEGREYDLADEVMVKGLSEEEFGRLLAAILAADHADALAGRPQPRAGRGYSTYQPPAGTAVLFPPLPPEGMARRRERAEALAVRPANDAKGDGAGVGRASQPPPAAPGSAATSPGE